MIPGSLGRRGVSSGSELQEARKSPAYWWYRTLQASDEYLLCCKSNGRGLLGWDYIELVDVSAGCWIDGEYVGTAGESRQGVFTHLSCPKCKRKFRPMFWARAFPKLFFSCPALAMSF